MSVGFHIVRCSLAALVLGCGIHSVTGARADDLAVQPRWPTAETPAWTTSPYHGVTDGNGRVIPCRCRYRDREFRLGEEVCMSTHLGVVMTRCDLMLNNTSWVPTDTPCTISRAKDLTAQELAAVR